LREQINGFELNALPLLLTSPRFGFHRGQYNHSAGILPIVVSKEQRRTFERPSQMI
jgi:hypothetical protein